MQDSGKNALVKVRGGGQVLAPALVSTLALPPISPVTNSFRDRFATAYASRTVRDVLGDRAC